MRVYLDNCCYNRPFDDQSQVLNPNTFDYTEWRRNNLFQGESVDSLCDKIEAFQASRGRVAAL